MTNFGILWHKKPASHLSSKQIMTEQKPTASAIGAVCFHASRGCGFPDFFYSVCSLVSPWLLLSMCATNWGNSDSVCFFFFIIIILVVGICCSSGTSHGRRHRWVPPGSVSGYQLSCSLAHQFDQPAVLMSQQRRLETCRPTLDLTACAKHSTLHNLAPASAPSY